MNKILKLAKNINTLYCKYMRYLLLIILFLNCSCGASKQIVMQTHDTTFDYYQDRFFAEAEKRGVYLERRAVIAFYKEDYLSECYRISKKSVGCSVANKFIQIKEDFYLNANYQERELLLFHELGHQLLNRRHLEGTIMSKSMMNWREYIRNRDKYLDILFLDVVKDVEEIEKIWETKL